VPFSVNVRLRRDATQAAVKACETLVPCANTDRMAAIGFCFGGMVVLDAARSGEFGGLRSCVSFHGVLDAPELFEKPVKSAPERKRTKVLVWHGDSDPYVPPEKLASFTKQMDDLEMDWEIERFPGIGHAFTRPEKIFESDLSSGFGYDEHAASKSWEETKRCFRKLLNL